jgi:SAM-dependent methyltransferase
MNVNKDGNRRVVNGRLVYYSQKTDPTFWDEHWFKELSPQFFAPYQQGFLEYFEKPFLRHLPPNGLVLEAGCGTGQWVIALRARGYHCLGTDYAVESLRQANKIAAAPTFGGDITNLGMASASCDAIISLGVVEHRQSGPEPFLREMTRVLKIGGKLLISVPSFHALRQWRARHGAYQDNVNGLDFYQQAFTREEFSAILEQTGYKILDAFTYDHRKSIRQEIGWVTKSGPFLSRVFQKVSDYLPYVNSQLGHMLMLIAEKQ